MYKFLHPNSFWWSIIQVSLLILCDPVKNGICGHLAVVIYPYTSKKKKKKKKKKNKKKKNKKKKKRMNK